MKQPTGGAETPVDEHNHALAALRYLVSKLDGRHMARLPKDSLPNDVLSRDDVPPTQTKRRWLSIHNEALWTEVRFD
jgi:hypothetical protein